MSWEPVLVTFDPIQGFATASRCSEGLSSLSWVPMLAAQQSPLAVHGLRKRYGDVVAVDGLDLEIAPGECFGLLGPNGAGKTTTIEICEGLLEPDEGEVSVLGLRWDRDEQALRQR